MSLTQKLGERGRFAKVSELEKYDTKRYVQGNSRMLAASSMYEFHIKEVHPEILYQSAKKYYKNSLISFSSPYSNCTPETGTIFCDVFEPIKTDTDHAILFVPGIGDIASKILKWFPGNFAKYGIPSFYIHLPYMVERTPKKIRSGELFMKADVEKAFLAFSHSVVDIRETLTFITQRYKKVSIVGYSLGGMLSIIAMAMDERIEKGVFVVTGGNFFHIDWESSATRKLRKEYQKMDKSQIPCGTIEGCAKVHEGMYDFIESVSSVKDILDSDKYLCYKYDPVFFAPLLRQRQVSMITASYDKVFPPNSVNDLWQALGKPPIFKIPSGHITSVLFRKRIAQKVMEFACLRGSDPFQPITF